jgi:hypothetical protein
MGVVMAFRSCLVTVTDILRAARTTEVKASSLF